MRVLNKFWLTGRRTHVRRREDKLKLHWIDRHSPKTFAAVLLIMMLSVIDAIFTLDLVHRGAVELNPVMAYYLDYSPLMFFWVKYILTWSAVLIILLTKNIYLLKTGFQVKSLFIIIPAPFLLVVHWELYLLFTYNN
jgi:hypothetical protein